MSTTITATVDIIWDRNRPEGDQIRYATLITYTHDDGTSHTIIEVFDSHMDALKERRRYN